MTRTEKHDLHTFLTLAEDWISGYRTTRQIPVFSDDREPLHFLNDEDLNSAIRACDACKRRTDALHERTESEVSAPDTCEAIVIPLAPLSEAAGALLDRMLAAIQLVRGTSVIVEPLLHCASSGDNDREDLHTCAVFIENRIEIHRPKCILALGRTAGSFFTGADTPLNDLRSRMGSWRSIPFLTTYEPDELLADEQLKRPAWEDLKRFRAELDRIKGM